MQSRALGVVEGQEAEEGKEEKEIGIISTANRAYNQENAGATIAMVLFVKHRQADLPSRIKRALLVRP